MFKASLKGRRCLRRVEILKKHEKSVTLQAFLLILGENHRKRLECHTLLAKKHEKSMTLQAFLLILGENN